MRFSTPCLVYGCVLTAVACGGGSSAPRPLAPVLSSQRVYYDDGIGFPDSARMAVRDQTTWEDVWARATYGQPSPPVLPVIDFGREMLIVAAAGRLSPGDQIRVDSVGVRNDVYVAVIRTTVECPPFPGDAHPVEIVRVPRDNKIVTFSERGQRRC